MVVSRAEELRAADAVVELLALIERARQFVLKYPLHPTADLVRECADEIEAAVLATVYGSDPTPS